MNHFFAILGGMGTLATTNFLAELNKRHSPTKDQDFFNYVLFNHADIPDRTSFILDSSAPSPLPALLKDIYMITTLNPEFIIMPCNTAHYFIEDLKKATPIPFIDMIEETVQALSALPDTIQKIGLAATEGTITSKLYEDKLTAAGFEVILPDFDLQKKINQLIYTSVKEQGIIDLELYQEILSDFKQLGNDITLLGCTELSLVNSFDLENLYAVMDAEKVLLDCTYQLALQMKTKLVETGREKELS